QRVDGRTGERRVLPDWYQSGGLLVCDDKGCQMRKLQGLRRSEQVAFVYVFECLQTANSGRSGSPRKFPVSGRSRQHTEVAVALDARRRYQWPAGQPAGLVSQRARSASLTSRSSSLQQRALPHRAEVEEFEVAKVG